MQQLRFFIRNGFTLYVSGDNLTHHQEYNALYGHHQEYNAVYGHR